MSSKAAGAQGDATLGQTTNAGRFFTALFDAQCRGERFEQGKVLYNSDRVIGVEVSHEYGKGIVMHASVRSHDPLKCAAPGRRYVTWLTLEPFTKPLALEACALITARP